MFWDHFGVRLSGSRTFLVVTHSFVSQTTHAFLGVLPLCFCLSACCWLKPWPYVLKLKDMACILYKWNPFRWHLRLWPWPLCRSSFWSDCEAKPIYEMTMSVCVKTLVLAVAFSSIVGKLLMISLSSFTCINSFNSTMSTIHRKLCLWPWPSTFPVSRSNANLHLSQLWDNYMY